MNQPNYEYTNHGDKPTKEFAKLTYPVHGLTNEFIVNEIQ